MMAPDLVLIVPCYNEARRLQESAFLDFVRQHPSVRILFVDDGSVDGTAALHARLAAAAPGSISALRLETNHGKAEAVRRGILEAMGRGPALVGFWDADLSTPLAAIDDFLNVAAKYPDIDLVLGSRVLLMGRDIRRRATRHYLGRVFATAASLALSLPVYDTQCGAKVFRVNEAMRRVFAAPFRSPWIFDVEILARYLSLPVYDTQCGAKVFRVNEAMRRVFAAPFRSPWIFDVEILARYLELPVDDGGTPRRSRIYELTVPAWYDVPGSKLEASDFVRSMFELVAIWRDRRAGRI